MNRYILFALLLITFAANKVNAQLTGVAINDNGAKADTSAILDLSVNTTSPKRGFLLPRITTAERDAIYMPAKGLLIYATNVDSLEMNVGTAASPNWIALFPGWKITGNSGTNSGTHFLGTTDNVSLRFRTNNLQRMVIDSLGRVGIGTSAPGQTLETLNGNLLINNNNNASGEFRIAEPSSSGSNYTAFKAQAQAADVTYTLPSSAGSAGQKLTTDGTGNLSWSESGIAVFIRKAADESVVNSTTLQNDDDFVFSFSANKTYEVSLMLKVHCSNGGRIKMQMSAPTGSTAFMGALTTKGGNNLVTWMPSTSSSYNIAAGALDESSDIVIIQGTITTGSTAGTFRVKWAQSNSDTDPTTIYAGSYAKAIQMQ